MNKQLPVAMLIFFMYSSATAAERGGLYLAAGAGLTFAGFKQTDQVSESSYSEINIGQELVLKAGTYLGSSTAVYAISQMSFYKTKSRANVTNGLAGAGLTYYKEFGDKPLFFEGAVGVASLMIDDMQPTSASLGYIIGGGYELHPHLQAGVSYMVFPASDPQPFFKDRVQYQNFSLTFKIEAKL